MTAEDEKVAEEALKKLPPEYRILGRDEVLTYVQKFWEHFGNRSTNNAWCPNTLYLKVDFEEEEEVGNFSVNTELRHGTLPAHYIRKSNLTEQDKGSHGCWMGGNSEEAYATRLTREEFAEGAQHWDAWWYFEPRRKKIKHKPTFLNGHATP